MFCKFDLPLQGKTQMNSK